jgi:hypothetical protein
LLFGLGAPNRWLRLSHLFSRQPHPLRYMVGPLLHREFRTMQVLCDLP